VAEPANVQRMRDGLPENGDVIASKFRIEHLLGRGGMGSVYAVTHLVTGKTLALKCLLPQLSGDASAVERFMREAQAVGRIQHRHVIDIFDVMEDGGLCFIVMPYLEGHTLTELLHGGTMTLDQALLTLVRVMEGVAAAHAAGIVHRDLKPCNILVCRGMDGRFDDPRVLDFGISRVLEEGTARLTASGAALGTPSYMALEQLVGDHTTDARADIFSMAVILYEVLAGKLPHVAQNAAGLALERQTNIPNDLALLRPDLPGEVTHTIMRALSTDRALRPVSMQAWADSLRPFVRELGEATVKTNLREGCSLAVTRTCGRIVVDGRAPTTPAASHRLRVAQLPLDQAFDAPSNTHQDRLAAGLLESGRPAPTSLSAATRIGALASILGIGAALTWATLGSRPTREARAKGRAEQTQVVDAAVLGALTPTVARDAEVAVPSEASIEGGPATQGTPQPAPSVKPAVVRPRLQARRATVERDAAVSPILMPVPTSQDAQPKVAPPTPEGLRPEDF
jgi:eukaryotic-like serine/threonine-protein kinase